jgi:hypothetical protein
MILLLPKGVNNDIGNFTPGSMLQVCATAGFAADYTRKHNQRCNSAMIVELMPWQKLPQLSAGR